MPIYLTSEQRQILIPCLTCYLFHKRYDSEKEKILSQDLIGLLNRSQDGIFLLRQTEKDILYKALTLLRPECLKRDYYKAYQALVEILS